jgi:hypothetical protein
MKNLGTWITAACAAGAMCVANVALSQATASPRGEVVEASVDVTATVAKVNHKTREVTLRTKDGQEYSFVAGDAVKNLDQVKKGDVVTASYTEALAYEVKKGGMAGSDSMATAGTAPAGMKPAGAAAGGTKVTIKVVAIDPSAPSITFMGPEGKTRAMKVNDPAKLQGVSVGDTVEITYAEAVGVKVEKAPKK